MGSELIISVAGIRGLYPAPLSPETAYRFGRAFGIYSGGRKIFVARDTRISGKVLQMSLMAGLAAAGKNIIDMDIAPTPQLTCLVEKSRGACGVIVSASHNPAEYNGLKFVSSRGTFLNEREGSDFLRVCDNLSGYPLADVPGEINPAKRDDLMEKYFSSICAKVDTAGIRKKKFKVVADVCQGVGALYTRPFLERFGCRTVMMNVKPHGVFAHNPEPLPGNLGGLSKRVLVEKADIGFAQDPDADRLAFVSEDGNIPGEEMTLAIAARNILGKTRGAVAVNLSTSSVVESIAEEFGIKVYRTMVGEVNVVEGMKKVGAVIGGEGNGGVIFPGVHFGRDSFVAMALILEYLAKRDRPLSALVSEFPRYTMLKEKLPLVKGKKSAEMMGKLKAIYGKKDKLNLEDGIKVIREDGWIHIRPSGTEPVLRVYVEGRSSKIARKYLAEVTGMLSG